VTKIVRTRSRPAPETSNGVVRTARKRPAVEPKEEDYYVNGEETACYMIRLNMHGSHPNWYDSYKVIQIILKRAEEEIKRKTTGGTCYFDMVYWPEEEVDKKVKKQNLKFERVKNDD
jgi:hypothetical protein